MSTFIYYTNSLTNIMPMVPALTILKTLLHAGFKSNSAWKIATLPWSKSFPFLQSYYFRYVCCIKNAKKL